MQACHPNRDFMNFINSSEVTNYRYPENIVPQDLVDRVYPGLRSFELSTDQLLRVIHSFKRLQPTAWQLTHPDKATFVRNEHGDWIKVVRQGQLKFGSPGYFSRKDRPKPDRPIKKVKKYKYFKPDQKVKPVY